MQGLHMDPMHAARMAALEAALCAVLRAAAADHDANDAPDAVSAELNADGLDVTYLRAGLAVGGEGL